MNKHFFPKALVLFLSLSVGTALAQTALTYEYRVPLKGLVVAGTAGAPAPSTPEALVLALRAEALPEGTVGEPYPAFDFKALLTLTGGNPTPPMSAVSWSATSGLPAGLTLSPSAGVLAGTPTVKNGAGTSFEVVATHEDTEGRQVFTIVVNGAVLQVTQISAGGSHTCAITTTGAAKCWGDGGNGRLGNGGTAQSNTPVAVTGLGAGVACR